MAALGAGSEVVQRAFGMRSAPEKVPLFTRDSSVSKGLRQSSGKNRTNRSRLSAIAGGPIKGWRRGAWTIEIRLRPDSSFYKHLSFEFR